MDNFSSPKNSSLGILGHRNSNVSISQASQDQNHQSHNTSSVHRKQKQSPNIVKANKLFPEDFFSGSQIGSCGSPTSQATLQLSTKNGTRDKSEQLSIQDDKVIQVSQQKMQQKQSISQDNIHKQDNQTPKKKKGPLKFKFPNEGQNDFEFKKINIQNKDNDQIQDEQQIKKHQKSKNSKQRKLLVEENSNQENINIISNNVNQEPFDGLKTQYVHLSLDSDKIAKIQGALRQIKKNKPFNQINSLNNQKGRNLENNSQSHKGSKLKTHKHEQKQIHQDECIEQQNTNVTNQSNRSNGILLPDLKSNYNRNAHQNYYEQCSQDNIGTIPDLNQTVLLSFSNQRQEVHSKVPVMLRRSLKREELELQNWQTIQVNNNQNQLDYLDSSQILIQNETNIRNLNEQSTIFNAGSPQTSRMHDFSSSNIYSNGKLGINNSNLLQPNQNHHCWNRSPQMKRELDASQNISSQFMYFPQSTRNQIASCSPSMPQQVLRKSQDKPVKFPNIFNHNHQSNPPPTLSFLNYQGSPQRNDNTNISSRFLNNSNQVSQFKKGKIALDHNCQVVRNMQTQLDTKNISRNNVIQERKETSESERSISPIIKQRVNKNQVKLDRKILTSRDHDEKWMINQEVEPPIRRSMGRIKSKSKLEKSNKNEMLLKNGQIYGQGKENAQLSQSGKCWYNSPRNVNQNEFTPFESSPDQLTRNDKSKEDKPRYSLPENRSKFIDNNEQQFTINLNQIKQQNDFYQSGKLTLQDLETPNFKQLSKLTLNNTLKLKKEQIVNLQRFSEKFHNNKFKLERQINGKLSLNQQIEEQMPFEFNSNSHDVFDDDQFNPTTQIFNEEYPSLEGRGIDHQDMRHYHEYNEYNDYQDCHTNTHANCHKCQKDATIPQNQQVQLESQKGNVELKARSPMGQAENEIKKLKVISKQKKIDSNITIENKDKLIKQIERNLKKKLQNSPKSNNLKQLVQQEQIIQTQKEELLQFHSNSQLQIKEGNCGNTPTNNNSQLQKKVPIIKKSQIQNQPKPVDNIQKINIVKNSKKVQGNQQDQMQGAIEQKSNNLNSNNTLTNNFLNNNNQKILDKFKNNNSNQQKVYHGNCNQLNQRNVQEEMPNIDHYKTSHFLESFQYDAPKLGKTMRKPLQSLENKTNIQDCCKLGSKQHSQEYSQQQTPFFQQSKQPTNHHINQIYMAAQIPQEFNGMITFMNIQQQFSDKQSNQQDGCEDLQDPLKQTSGSLMRGTILSVTHTNQTFNQNSNNNNINARMSLGPQNSCNNSIIMLASDGNYMTSDFGGQLLSNSSPLSTQHLVILQQQINFDKGQGHLNNMISKTIETEQHNQGHKQDGFKKVGKKSKNRSNSQADKENQYFNDNQQLQQEQYQQFQNPIVLQHKQNYKNISQASQKPANADQSQVKQKHQQDLKKKLAQ